MKTLFITGGSGGIGDAIKAEFIRHGFSAIAPGSKELDLSDNQSIENYLKKNNPHVDVFIHCAGINNPKLLSEISDEEMLKTLQINTLSSVKLIKFFAPYFKEKNNGHILLVSSIWSVVSKPGRLAYTISKSALNGLVKTLALELGPSNVKINTLAPGFVDTPLTSKNNTPEELAKLISNVPLGKLITPEEIAKAAYFLCSDENTMITGQTIVVDGGFTSGVFPK